MEPLCTGSTLWDKQRPNFMFCWYCRKQDMELDGLLKQLFLCPHTMHLLWGSPNVSRYYFFTLSSPPSHLQYLYCLTEVIYVKTLEMCYINAKYNDYLLHHLQKEMHLTTSPSSHFILRESINHPVQPHMFEVIKSTSLESTSSKSICRPKHIRWAWLNHSQPNLFNDFCLSRSRGL